MVRIRQHGQAGELFDLRAFFEDVAAMCPVEQWSACVEECLGDGASEVEGQTFPHPAILEAEQLRDLYRGISQTIDGTFVGLRNGKERCRLVAVDSSYWEVSGPPEFEAHMKNKYGAYGSDGA